MIGLWENRTGYLSGHAGAVGAWDLGGGGICWIPS